MMNQAVSQDSADAVTSSQVEEVAEQTKEEEESDDTEQVNDDGNASEIADAAKPDEPLGINDNSSPNDAALEEDNSINSLESSKTASSATQETTDVADTEESDLEAGTMKDGNAEEQSKLISSRHGPLHEKPLTETVSFWVERRLVILPAVLLLLVVGVVVGVVVGAQDSTVVGAQDSTSSEALTCSLCYDEYIPRGLDEFQIGSNGTTCTKFKESVEQLVGSTETCLAHQATAWRFCGCPSLPPPVKSPSCFLCNDGAQHVGPNAMTCNQLDTYAGLIGTLPSTCLGVKDSMTDCVCQNDLPTTNATEAVERRIGSFTKTLEGVSGDSLQDQTSAQYQALSWLASVDGMRLPIQSPLSTLVQRYVAALLFFETTGDSWRKKANFLSENSECEWNEGEVGLFCNSHGELDVINLASNNLSGKFPEEITFLRALREIKLSANYIIGSLPSSIGHLQQLERLEMDNTSIDSSIPEDIFTLPKLRTLWMDNVSLTGQLPPTMSKATALKSLSIYDSSLTGPIPDLEKLSSLVYLGLGSNSLSGSLPSFERNTKLLGIWLEENSFIGETIPPSIGNIPNLQDVSLHTNGFVGTIPSFEGNSGALRRFYLYGNKLRGRLDSLFQSLPSDNLVELEVNRNILTGSIPTIIGNFNRLIELFLDTNVLSGSLPTELGELSLLETLSLRFCGLRNHIPSELGQLLELETLDLQENLLSSTVPSQLGQLSGLVALGLAYNPLLTGTVASEIASIPTLETLFLERTGLVGNLNSTFCRRDDPIDRFRADCSLSTITCECCTECCDESECTLQVLIGDD